MFKHYIKFALRNFRSNRIIFGGSLFTICLGALSVSLLALYVFNEFTRNGFHKREKDIYLTVVKSSPESQWDRIQPSLYSNFDYMDYPEIESATTVMKYSEGDMAISYGLKIQYPEGIVVDSTFFDILDFELNVGDKKTILSDPDAILISEKLSERLFGKENPIGKKVIITTFLQDTRTVRGILGKIPPTSSLTFDFVMPDSNVPNQFARSGVEFLLFHPGSDYRAFTEKIEDLLDGHPQFKGSTMGLVPFEEVYFNETKVDFANIFSDYGDRNTLYILMIILCVIVGISAMNISNLQIINTNTSVKFIVLSVINGAQKRDIFYQKLTELGLLIIISVFTVTVFQQLLLPEFNAFTQVPIYPSIGLLIALNTGIVLILAVLSLVYPLVAALNIPIVNSLKNQTFFTSKLMGKKWVLVAQYTLTFVLLISSVIVVKQLDMMLNKDLGFTSENTITTKLFPELAVPIELMGLPSEQDKNDPDKAQKRSEKIAAYENLKAKQKEMYEFVKNELRTNPSIMGFSQGNSPLEVYKSPWKSKNEGSDYLNKNTLTVSPGHKNIFDFELVEGRFFEEERDKAHTAKVVINEAAKRFWGINDISDGRIFNKYWAGDEDGDGYWADEPVGYEIIGVVKDFNSERLSLKPEPLVMVYFDQKQLDNFLIQFEKGATAAGLKVLDRLFHEANPNEVFTYSFLSDEIGEMYEKEKQLSILYIVFTALALLISTIGLFTIALYDTRRRVKEIGIRKVNGAKTHEILVMLNTDFSKLVVVAFVLACPLTYFLMDKWLENFAYRTDISLWIFLVSGAATLLIALLTVSWQSYRAANSNPVESLRTE